MAAQILCCSIKDCCLDGWIKKLTILLSINSDTEVLAIKAENHPMGGISSSPGESQRTEKGQRSRKVQNLRKQNTGYALILMWLWLLLPSFPPLHIFPWSVCFLKLSTILMAKETKQAQKGNCKPNAHRTNEPPALGHCGCYSLCRCCGVLLGISVGMKVVCIKFSRMFTVGKVFHL